MVAMTDSTVRAAALRKWCFSLAKVLQLDEDLFDRIEIGRVFGKEEKLGVGRPDCPANGFSLVAAKIVHDHEVARRKHRCQHLLEIGFEAFARSELNPASARRRGEDGRTYALVITKLERAAICVADENIAVGVRRVLRPICRRVCARRAAA